MESSDEQQVSDETLWSWVDRAAPELDAFLDEHPEQRPRVQALRTAIAAASAVHPAPPARIGSCSLGRKVGEGGMGVVYEAMQEAPRRRVAVKLLKGSVASQEGAAARFRREAEALARLDHGNIARIHSAGEEHGVPYIVMEFVDGLPIGAHAEEHQLDRRARIALFRTVLSAVAHAHGAGIVHRDLKPENVLVAGDGSAKVLDFGIAQLSDAEGGAGLTRTGALLGTLGYMAPEQVSGRFGAVGPASDVYALGVMLYELLLGQTPIAVDLESPLQSARDICERVPRRPRSIDRRMDADLEAVLLRALAKRPARRYPNAGAFDADLERVLSGDPVEARRSTLGRRVRLFLARHPAAVAIAALLLFAASAGGVAAFSLRPDWFAKIIPWRKSYGSPFDAVRYSGRTPEVLVGGTWYELMAMDGVPAPLLIEEMRQVENHWKKRFAEDLSRTMLKSGRVIGSEVDLQVRHLDTRQVETLRGVPVTAKSRASSWTYRQECLGNSIAVRKNWVELDDFRLTGGPTRTVSTIAGMPVPELLALEPGGERELARLVAELLAAGGSHRAGDPVELTGGFRGEGARPGERWTRRYHLDAADLRQASRTAEELSRLLGELRR